MQMYLFEMYSTRLFLAERCQKCMTINSTFLPDNLSSNALMSFVTYSSLDDDVIDWGSNKSFYVLRLYIYFHEYCKSMLLE